MKRYRYVKSDDDVFHSAAGMIEMLTVSETASEAPEPEADIEINISQAGGIEIVSIPRPHPIRHRSILPRQDYTIAVHFEDQAAYENLVQHDLHLARLTGDADLGELGAWMNWFSEDGFKRSVPEGVEFVGGTQEMPAGQTAYFTANFTEDRYVLVAEIPNPRDKGMLKTITVPLWWFGTN